MLGDPHFWHLMLTLTDCPWDLGNSSVPLYSKVVGLEESYCHLMLLSYSQNSVFLRFSQVNGVFLLAV